MPHISQIMSSRIWDDEHKCIDALHLWGGWGYGSKFGDGVRWNADLCIDCAYQVKDYIESKGGKILITVE